MKTTLHTVKYKKRHYTKDEIAEILTDSLVGDELTATENGIPCKIMTEEEYNRLLDEWYTKEIKSWLK